LRAGMEWTVTNGSNETTECAVAVDATDGHSSSGLSLLLQNVVVVDAAVADADVVPNELLFLDVNSDDGFLPVLLALPPFPALADLNTLSRFDMR